MTAIRERAMGVIKDHFEHVAEKVTERASFVDDLGADSLDSIELIMAFEEEFRCEIPDDAVTGIATVGECIAALEKRLSQPKERV